MSRRRNGRIPYHEGMNETLLPPELAFDRWEPTWDYDLTVIAPKRTASYQSSRHLAMCGTAPSPLRQSASLDSAHQPLQEEARQALQERASILMCRSESDDVARDVRPLRFSRPVDAIKRMQSSPALLSSGFSNSRPPLPRSASSSSGVAATPSRTSKKTSRSSPPPLTEVEFPISNSWDYGSWDAFHDDIDTNRQTTDLVEDRQTPATDQTWLAPRKKAGSSTKKNSRRKKSSRRAESMRLKSMLDDDTEWKNDSVDPANSRSKFLLDNNEDTPSPSCLSFFPPSPPRQNKTDASSPSRKDRNNSSTAKKQVMSPKSVMSVINCGGGGALEEHSCSKQQHKPSRNDKYPSTTKVETPSDLELRELRRELKFLKRWAQTPAQEIVVPPRRVRFEDPLVTSVKHRPRTLPEEIPNLFFDEDELQQLEKDRANRILEEQFEVVAAQMDDGQMVVSVSFPKRLSLKEMERYKQRTNPSGNAESLLVAI